MNDTHVWEDNIKIDLEVGWGYKDWTDLVHDRASVDLLSGLL